MSRLSRWLDAINQLFTNDITGLVTTIRDGYSEISETDESPTERNVYIFRTAEMMETNSGGSGNTVNPTVARNMAGEAPEENTSVLSRLLKCFRRRNNQNTSNQQGDVSVELVSGTTTSAAQESDLQPVAIQASESEAGNRSTENLQHSQEPSCSQSMVTQETTLEDMTSGVSQQGSADSNDQQRRGMPEKEDSTPSDDDGLLDIIPVDNSAPTAQELKQKERMKRQDATQNNSSSESERGSSAGSKKDGQTTSTPISPLAQPNPAKKDPEDKDEGGDQGSSGPVRLAKLLYRPVQYLEYLRPSIPHHSELFGSPVRDQSKEEQSHDWLDYLRNKYSEDYILWH